MFSFVLALNNLKRQSRRTILAAILCAALSCFLYAYVSNIQANQNRLPEISASIPVTAHISSLNGSMNVGLLIKGELLHNIENSGFVTDMVKTVQLAASFAPETDEEKILPKRIQLSGINALSAYPSITIMKTETASEFLNGQNNSCIVDDFFLRKNGLAIGDEIKLALYRHEYTGNMAGMLRYEYLTDSTFKIAGSFVMDIQSSPDTPPDIIASIDWLESIFITSDVEFHADSASFALKEPLDLNEFKTAMHGQKLMSVNPRTDNRVDGNALVVNDETFVRAASSVQNNLKTLKLFAPLMIITILAAGYVVSHLNLQTRREEFAIMRALGMGQDACLLVFILESAVAAASGALIGMLVALAFWEVSALTVFIVIAGFTACYLSGTFIAVSILGRVDVIRMLCGKE